YVTRFQQKEARGCGTPTAWAHVGDHGHRRRDDFLDGLPHGVHQSARRVETYEHQRSVFVSGLGESASNNFDGDGMDHPIHVNGDYFRGRRDGLRHEERHRHRCENRATQDSSQSNLKYYTPLQIRWSETWQTVTKLTFIIERIETFDAPR